MRFLRFTLLQTYFSNIKKNKRKALLLINTGIFFSIFAVSSAIVSFFIERDISIKQSEIIEYQISIKESSTMLASFETIFDQFAQSLKIENSSRIEKQLFSETKLGNKIFSAKDFYTPYLQYAKKDIEDIERPMFSNDSEYGPMKVADLFDIDNKYVQEIISTIKDAWSKEDVENFTNSMLKANQAYQKIKKINFENYDYKKNQSFKEISLEIEKYEKNHMNLYGLKIIDDYFTVIDFEYALSDYFSELINLMKSFSSANEELLEEANEEILYLSNKEKNIILVTFLFQFVVFIIIQVFEVNSVGFNLKKKKL